MTANSERGEHVGISTSFKKASENNNALHVSNESDETLHGISDKVSELSVPGTRFDRQAHTHHIYAPWIKWDFERKSIQKQLQLKQFETSKFLAPMAELHV